MRGAVRLNDFSRGHGCFPSKPNIEASTDTFVNGRGSVRFGDAWATHCCGSSCHGSVSSEGSPNVFINGKPGVRIYDMISCSDAAYECSSDTFYN